MWEEVTSTVSKGDFVTAVARGMQKCIKIDIDCV